MAQILITGSTDGLGLMAAELLAGDGHAITLHARNQQRAAAVRERLATADHIVIGDLASIDGMRQVAKEANSIGRFDAVIHNAGVGYREPRRVGTPDGLSHVFAINVLAPYLLTALITPPDRLVYLGSGMHRAGNPALDDLQWTKRRWDGAQAYSDSKLFDVVLAFAVARHWPAVLSNALEPGWVPTKMGGPGEPLTESEIRVLRYLPTHTGAPEIAAELFVSANTVKTHLRHLYRKLGAHSRHEAVQRAPATSMSENKNQRPFGKIKVLYPNGRWWQVPGNR